LLGVLGVGGGAEKEPSSNRGTGVPKGQEREDGGQAKKTKKGSRAYPQVCRNRKKLLWGDSILSAGAEKMESRGKDGRKKGMGEKGKGGDSRKRSSKRKVNYLEGREY